MEHPNFSFASKQAIFNKFSEGFARGLERLTVFLSPYAYPETLAKNYTSLDWLERYAIAKNPTTPQHIRQHLAKDGNRIVRNAAIL